MALEVASLPATEMVAPFVPHYCPAMRGWRPIGTSARRLCHHVRNHRDGRFADCRRYRPLADPLVRIALGAQWLAAIPVLKVLAIYGAINVCVANTWPVFIALGRPWVNTALTALGAFLLVPLLFWSVRDRGHRWRGLVYGGGCSRSCSQATGTAACLLALSPRELLSRVWRTLVARLEHCDRALPSPMDALRHPPIGSRCSCCAWRSAHWLMATLWLLWLAAGRNDDPEPEAIRMLRQLLPTGPRGA